MRHLIGIVLGFAIALAPAALAVAASARLSVKSVDAWRGLAWVPPIPLVAWWAYFLIGVARDPTSHNLWPFEMVIWTAVSLTLFVLFLLARALSRLGKRLFPGR